MLKEIDHIKGLNDENKSSLSQLVALINTLDMEKVQKEVYEKGVTLSEYLKIPTQKIEAIYAVGYEAFAVGDLVLAKSVFEVVATLNAKDSRFYRALGMVYFMQEEFGRSLDMHLYSLCLDNENESSAYYATECMYKLGVNEKLMDMIELAEINCERSKNKGMIAKCKLMRRKIENRLKKSDKK